MLSQKVRIASIYFMKNHRLVKRRQSALRASPGILLTGVLLLLAACGGTPVAQHSNNPPYATPAATPSSTSTSTPQEPTTVPSPFHPGSAAAAALNDCAASAQYCFSPEQVQTFYDLNPLYKQGYDGKGMTIVIMVSYGSPTIKDDLRVFDQTFGLPDPPSFQIVTPLQTSPTTTRIYDWQFETTMDVEIAHAIAPGANIVLLVSPDDLSEGVSGLSQYEQTLSYALDHHLGQIFSFSFAVSEPALATDSCNQDLGSGQDVINQFDQQVFQPAVTDHVTVLAATGDAGSTNPSCMSQDYSFQNVVVPASDPLVTAVGGTELTLGDQAGNYGTESVWNDSNGASGGGISQFFSEPDWQKSLPNQSSLKGMRAIPDVSAQAAGHFPMYLTGDGWDSASGTSMAVPIWAGIVAIADQMAGKPLGFLNPALYKLAGKGFHDITDGNNSYDNVQGFSAGPGWDMASGWGSPDAAILIPSLISTVEQLGS